MAASARECPTLNWARGNEFTVTTGQRHLPEPPGFAQVQARVVGGDSEPLGAKPERGNTGGSNGCSAPSGSGTSRQAWLSSSTRRGRLGALSPDGQQVAYGWENFEKAAGSSWLSSQRRKSLTRPNGSSISPLRATTSLANAAGFFIPLVRAEAAHGAGRHPRPAAEAGTLNQRGPSASALLAS